MKHVEELSLVFMDALDLHIEHRVRVYNEFEPHLYDLRKPFLIGLFYIPEGLAEVRGTRKRRKSSELREVLDPFRSDMPGDKPGEPGVCLVQPAPRSNAVSNVDDLVRGETVKVGEDGLLHKIGMYPGHAVDLMAADNGQMRHAKPASVILIHYRHAPETVLLTRVIVPHLFQKTIIDLVDDLEMAGQYGLQKG